MSMSPVVLDRERDKFVETVDGNTAVRTLVANDSSDPITVSGTLGASAPTGPFKISRVVVTDTATNPLALPLSNRFGLSIRNRSQVNTVYIGKDAAVTPDDTATGGWEVGPNEDFHIDLDDSNSFFLITSSGQSAIVKILEIASTGAGSGGGGLSRVRELTIGAIDGVNLTYAITQTPASETYFTLYRSGILLTPGTHYTRVGTTITMVNPPQVGQTLEAIYEY